MPTETLPTRKTHKPETGLAPGFYAALALHLLVFAALGLAAFFNHRSSHWGDANPNPGSIQASMVTALPLPPRQRFKEDSVLASDKPSVAPTPPPPVTEPKAKASPAPPKAAPAPKPGEILIPNKVQPKTPIKPVERPQPVASKRTAPPPPLTPKATTGETAGIQIPQSITQLKNGTASITVEERAFGDRYAYYIRLISQKVNEAWNRQEVDASSAGKRTTVTFGIDRDGTPVDPHVTLRSGSGSLDSSALRAIQRIDSFGPLPAGDHITIAFSFDFRAP